MGQDGIRLTSTEWAVLDCLWEEAPQTMPQLARRLARTEGWAKGTTTTMLKRMTEKGLISCRPGERARLYFPEVDRHTAVLQETRGFLHRVHRGSISMMMSAAAEQEELSQTEIDELYEILKRMEEKSHD